MAIDLDNLISGKLQGITTNVTAAQKADHINAGAIDILEKIKTYKQEDLQKFLVEEQVSSSEEDNWTTFNATGLYAWEIMEVKRSSTLKTATAALEAPSQQSWKIATRLESINKSDYSNPASLKFIVDSFPGYTVESYSNIPNDGDNDALANVITHGNYIVTVYPQVPSTIYHSWKIKYIPMPSATANNYNFGFHVSYYPALAIYVAKNIILNELNRLLLLEEDIELATELKNHYALLEQEYASLMNVPPQKGQN